MIDVVKNAVLMGTLCGSGLCSVASADSCEPQWTEGLFCVNGPERDVYAAVTWDDGTGEALYMAGDFDVAGCAYEVGNIVRWDGENWSALTNPMGTSMTGRVRALAVFDDGTGPALYAGGDFSAVGGLVANNIARWDGSSWSLLAGPSGVGTSGEVYSLTVFDDGTGPALYAGGVFNSAGGQPVSNIAKWDGSEWSPVNGDGSGLDRRVSALCSYDDGNGPALYAGGLFLRADGEDVNYIARWDGQDWSALDSGENIGVNNQVFALSVFDDGSGEALFAGGQFGFAGGEVVNRIAKWDGTSWSALQGPNGFGVSGGQVETLVVCNDGTGNALYAGGGFREAGGLDSPLIARWNGLEWSSVGVPLVGPFEYGMKVSAIAGCDSGSGATIYAAGRFPRISDQTVQNAAKWDGVQWQPMKDEVGNGLGSDIPGFIDTSFVKAFEVFDDGCGVALFVGGDFSRAGMQDINQIARWNGSGWSPLDSEFGSEHDGSVEALKSFDDGSGPALYVGRQIEGIDRWDGTEWSLVTGSNGGSLNFGVDAIEVFDDGTGPALYAAGRFTEADGKPANRIAKWDGTDWFALGEGLNDGARDLVVFDDGSGDALYAIGSFTLAGGQAANYIAKWDGQAWDPLGSGLGAFSGAPYIETLAVFDDGTGAALYVGGSFSLAGGVPAQGIAKWNGSEWSAVVTGITGRVIELTVHDDGTGEALYLGGVFTVFGGPYISNIAKWDGAELTPLGTGTFGHYSAVSALCSFEDAGGSSLFAGGFFDYMGDQGASKIARWGCPLPVCPADVSPDGTIDMSDLNVVLANFGQVAPQGDANQDGVVDLADLNEVLGAFGSDCP